MIYIKWHISKTVIPVKANAGVQIWTFFPITRISVYNHTEINQYRKTTVSGYSLYQIGRSSTADIQIGDSSVSRIHAELTVTRNGSYYLTDCGSGGGSFIARDGEWAPIQQQFIGATENILLGRYQTTAQKLVSLLKDRQAHSTEQTPSPVDDLPAGPVRRNVETGEIISDKD